VVVDQKVQQEHKVVLVIRLKVLKDLWVIRLKVLKDLWVIQ
jgi:hypothetical protein